MANTGITQVKDLAHLDAILADGFSHDFFVSLNMGLRSSKTISMAKNKYYVYNLIDDSEETLRASDFNLDKSTVSEALRKGALYHEA